ncbi:MAG: right-handed parallel beta-helix repeat-containing protein [Pirellulales bacterium]
MRTWVMLLALAVALAACRVGVSRDLYVNNVIGNENLSGMRELPNERQGPVRSIQRALRLAQPGDHVHIARTDAPYREQISISGPCLRGRADRPFIISGNGAVLDGTVVAEQGAWQHEAGDVFALRPRRLTYQQLYRASTPAKRVRLVDFTAVDERLQPLQWALASDRILFRVEHGQLPAAYELRHAGLQTGITLYNTEHVRIENFIVQGFQQDGINAHELARDCVIAGVECRANGRSGISVGGLSRVNIDNSNLYDNGVAQLRVEGQARAALEACDVAESPETLAYDVQGGELTIDGKLYVAP